MRKVAVFGAAKSGVAAANFLAGRGEPVVITDARPESELPLAAGLDARVERAFGGHPSALLDDVRLIVLSPGIPATIPPLVEAAARSIPVISEVELAFRHLEGTVVAITGSNGKSTTTALIGEILQVAGRDPVVAGNIGEPLIAAVAPGPRTYVIELSSFQLETVDSFHANVALLLNITPDHLDRYPSMDDYAAAKHRIFRNQTARDLAIVNADDPRTREPKTPARILRFSSRPADRPAQPGAAVPQGFSGRDAAGVPQPGAAVPQGFSGREAAPHHDAGVAQPPSAVPGVPVHEDVAFLRGDELVMRFGGSERAIPRGGLRLPGRANAENALAAWLAARALGIPDVDVQIAFGSFAGLPHRMVLVRERSGVRWINDSKGTNVDATLGSLAGADDGRVVLILGGKDKNGEFERLRDLVGAKARAVLTIGAAAGRIEQALAGAATIVPCGTLDRAVAWARDHAEAGDTVLLSPACASFDQYDNFEHRGRHFEELVRALGDGGGA